MLRAVPTAIEPDVWTLAFHRTTPYWFVRWLAVGRYKHVSAFAWVAPLRMWVVYDVSLKGSHVLLLPDSRSSEEWLTSRTLDADLMMVPRREAKRPPIGMFSCVTAVKHLLGLRCGALLPTGLWRHCLANGGQIVNGQAAHPNTHSGADASCA